jgi:hypothetical protein
MTKEDFLIIANDFYIKRSITLSQGLMIVTEYLNKKGESQINIDRLIKALTEEISFEIISVRNFLIENTIDYFIKEFGIIKIVQNNVIIHVYINV